MIAEARVAISKVNLNEVLVSGESLERYRQHLTQLVQMDQAKADQYWQDTIASVEKMYGFSGPNEREKAFVFNDGVAIIPVHGILLNKFNSCWGFVTGYNFIRAQMNAADADDDVKLIVFDDDSPGGDKAGCFELTADIRALKKPTLAMIDDTACSGGYAIAAACNRVVAVPSAQVGSIGVYRLHIDVSGNDAQAGVKFTYVFSGQHKVDGNPHEPLAEDVRANWQARVDKSREEFVADVALGRDMDAEAVRATEAEVYPADEALALGLVDAVSTATQAVSSFLAETGDDEPTDEDDEDEAAMALPKNDAELAAMIAEAVAAAAPDTSKIASDAVKADRERRQAITALDEAKERPKLAATLADTDGMTAETAKVILASAAVEKAEGGKGKEGTSFQKAMDKAGGANVGTEGEGGSGTEDTGREQASADEKASAGILQFVAKDRRVKKEG